MQRLGLADRAGGHTGGATWHAVDAAEGALQSLRASAMMAPTAPAATSATSATTVPLLDVILTQADMLQRLLTALVDVRTRCSAAARAARLLPTSLAYAQIHADNLARHLPLLLPLLADAMSHHPSRAKDVADAVAGVALSGVVLPGEYEPLLVRSGVVRSLVELLTSGEGTMADADEALGELLAAHGLGTDGTPGAVDADYDGIPDYKQNKPAKKPQSARSERDTGGADDKSPSRHAPGGGVLSAHGAIGIPATRPTRARVAKQEAAARALLAISRKHPKVCEAIGQDEATVRAVAALALDHSTRWGARLAAISLLATLVASGGPAADMALRCGAFTALVELMERDTYPYYRQVLEVQDGRGSKDGIIDALKTIALSPELQDTVAEGQGKWLASGVASGYRLVLNSSNDVLEVAVRSLWGVVETLRTLMAADTSGGGRFVDATQLGPLAGSCRKAVAALGEVCASETSAVDMLRRVGALSKLGSQLLQALNTEPQLAAELVGLRARLSTRK
ncbi:hypothetical protein FOA52_009129 [Chlamydomonas sp. UWO 241]|nr:hypothetical protein FOA52_009129 [Chlamydomonas sp. UWO 241]